MAFGDAGLYLFEGRGPEIELGYTIVADPRNPASVRVLEKIGMRPVGRHTAYGHEHPLYRQVVASRDRG